MNRRDILIIFQYFNNISIINIINIIKKKEIVLRIKYY
jgi:hypothetical protein